MPFENFFFFGIELDIKQFSLVIVFLLLITLAIILPNRTIYLFLHLRKVPVLQCEYLSFSPPDLQWFGNPWRGREYYTVYGQLETNFNTITHIQNVSCTDTFRTCSMQSMINGPWNIHLVVAKRLRRIIRAGWNSIVTSLDGLCCFGRHISQTPSRIKRRGELFNAFM